MWATILLAWAGFAPPLHMVAEMGLLLGALVITRRLMSTERARAEFAPLALRPWFLASAVGAMASGIALGRLALAFSHFPALARDVMGLAALAIPLFLAGLGVLRMRTWGVALGALTAIASIPIVLWMRDTLLTAPVLLAAVPAALMAPLVAIARVSPNPNEEPIQTSNALDEAPHHAARARFVPATRVDDDGLAHHGDLIELVAEPAAGGAAVHRG
jgi:hypothetical protein